MNFKSNILLTATVLLACSNLFAQTQTPDVSQCIFVRNDFGENQTLCFGLDPLATDGVDVELGENDLPPWPPIDVWDIRLKLPPNDWNELSSLKDFRNETNFPYTGQREYRLAYQIGENTDTLFIEWDFPPEITGVLQDLIVGTLVNENMQGSGSFTMVRGVMPDPLLLTQLKLLIDYNNVIADVNSEVQLPVEFKLAQNFPNPFNPTTTINVSIPFESEIALLVYDILGNEVGVVTEGRYSAGSYDFEFNANGLASGVYLYRLNYEGGMITRKMSILK